MRKNKMMRAASGLLVAVLLTTCIISGTFAKYVTSDNGSDSARVAKWGVNVVMSDDSLFNTTYQADDTKNGQITNSVVSSDTDKVVAPGTKEANTLTFTISGEPEVAVNVNAGMTVSDDVKLAGNTGKTYPDMTTGGSTTDTFEQTKDYYPVVYTLKKDNNQVAQGNLTAIKTYIEGLSGNYQAGNNADNSLAKINGTYTLSWAWKFDENGNDNVDKADTLLGDLAAETVNGVSTADYDLNTNFAISITVTQID